MASPDRHVKQSDAEVAKAVWDNMSQLGRERAARHMAGPNPHVKRWRKKYAPALGLNESQTWALAYMLRDGKLDPDEVATAIEGRKPGKDLPIEELIRRSEETFNRKNAYTVTRQTHVIELPDNLPFGIVHFGDPHLDADGCDWGMLRAWINCVTSTEGMMGGNIGDTTNNWVGRLQELYKEQNVTEHDAFRLAEWFIRTTGIEWAYIQLGNHDLWNNGGLLFEKYWAGSNIHVMEKFETNLRFVWPDESEMAACLRHDFRGGSQMHNVQGPLKRSISHPGSNLYLQGHIHSHGYYKSEDIFGEPFIAACVRGFKKMDSYAHKLDFKSYQHGEAYCTIFDPWAEPMSKIRLIEDPLEAARVLSDLRERRASASHS